MAALSIAILNRSNKPLYLEEFVVETTSSSAISTTPQSSRVSVEKEIASDNGSSTRTVEDSDDDVSIHQNHSSSSMSSSTRLLSIMHGTLNQLEKLREGYSWRKEGATGSDAMFVGLLARGAEMRVYGYMTTTGNVILLVVQDERVSQGQANTEEAIKRLMINIHHLYMVDVMNPFKEIGSPVVSKIFQKRLMQQIAAFNQAEGMI